MGEAEKVWGGPGTSGIWEHEGRRFCLYPDDRPAEVDGDVVLVRVAPPALVPLLGSDARRDVWVCRPGEPGAFRHAGAVETEDWPEIVKLVRAWLRDTISERNNR